MECWGTNTLMVSLRWPDAEGEELGVRHGCPERERGGRFHPLERRVIQCTTHADRSYLKVLNVESRLGQSGSTATANAEGASPTTSALPAGATALNIDFSDYSSTSASVESFLLDHGELPFSCVSFSRTPRSHHDPSPGLKITTRLIGGTPFTHTFTPDNVNIAEGTLQLTVSAGAVDDVKSAQLQTVGEYSEECPGEAEY